MVETIKEILELNRTAYDAVRKGFHRGMSEKDIKDLITHACGVSPISGDFVGGVRSSQIEGEASNYLLSDGDTLILDLQFFKNGLYSDTTRTFFIGEPTDEMRAAYHQVLYAKEAGEAVLGAGVRACDVYKTVKTAFLTHEKYFPHHAGHRIGEEPVLQPQFLPDRTAPLTLGMVVALEPGLYFDGLFGIRLEDNYFITDKGAVNLFNYTLDIEDFIL